MVSRLQGLFEESMPDDDDRVFYEVSLSIEDSFLVTGNLKHYLIFHQSSGLSFFAMICIVDSFSGGGG